MDAKEGEIERIKASLAGAGVAPSRRSGQNFLIDRTVAGRHVDHADIGKGDVVLEIGPGLGILTALLAKRAKRVIAVEKDPRLVNFLEGLDNVEVLVADALVIEFPRFDKVVANLPYQISSPITLKLLDYRFSTGVLMYQKEFAERLVAESGRKSSRLSLKVYYKCACEIIEYVPRSAFYPAPRVDSALVRMVPRPPPFNVDNDAFFFRVVTSLYLHRRKKIRNALVEDWRYYCRSPEALKEALEGAPFTDRRVEELEPEQIGELANTLNRKINLGHK